MIKKKKSKMSMRERLMARKEEMKRNSQGGNIFSLKEGTTRFRHLPLPPDEEPAMEVVHFYLGQELRGVISPATFGEPCAIMKTYEKFKNSKNSDDREFAKKFSPKKRYFAAVVRYKDEKGLEIDHQAGVKPLILTPGLYNELIDMYLDEDEAGDFTNAETGYDIKYVRTGTGKMDTEYAARACKPTKLHKKYAKEIYNIEEMIKAITPSYEETKEIIKQFLSMDPDELDQPAEKKISKKKKRSQDI